MKIVDEKTAYEDLANAIILQAIDDYTFVSNKNGYSIYREGPRCNHKEIRDFIYGDWFALLTDSDPKYIFNIMVRRRMKHAKGEVSARATSKLGLDNKTAERLYQRKNASSK